MKKTVFIFLALIIAANLTAYKKDDNGENINPPENFENMKLKITIGNRELTATFENNNTAKD